MTTHAVLTLAAVMWTVVLVLAAAALAADVTRAPRRPRRTRVRLHQGHR